MHFEILVEDISGKAMLEILLPKILAGTKGNTFTVHAYKGIGSIPKDLKTSQDPCKRALLNQLPRLLNGYGRTYAYDNTQYAVIVVCDLDKRDKQSFLKELHLVLDSCKTKPQTTFCLAIEESESWLLGDKEAVVKAYPKCNKKILKGYVNDSICGTWERLADVVYKGGAKSLKAKGIQAVGTEKTSWAKNIGNYLEVTKNKSPSFMFFVNCIREYLKVGMA